MRQIRNKFILISIVVLGCVWSIYPPSEKVRLGRDLSGGVSLIYSVRMPEGVDREAVLNQTIEVLKERVNPEGVLDIGMTPLGTDRIEIVMPLPSEEVKNLGNAYRGNLKGFISSAELKPADVRQALDSGDREGLLRGGDETDRGRRVQELWMASDRLTLAEKNYEDLSWQVDSLEKSLAEQEIADADIAFEEAFGQVLAISLPSARISKVLALSTKRPILKGANGEPLLNATTGDPELGFSDRQIALQQIEGEYPNLKEALNNLVASYDLYQSKRTGFDDPEDLIRLLRGAGVLEFRIAVNPSNPEGVSVDMLRSQLAEVGAANTDSLVADWYPLHDLKQWYDTPEQLTFMEQDPVSYFEPRGLIAGVHDSVIHLLLYNTANQSMTHEGDVDWSIESTGRTIDQLGRPAVSFALNSAGGGMLGALTGGNVGRPMAIVLDGRVYSAPTLQSQIIRQGIITGTFSDSDINYLTKVLAAGSLEARLSPEPISVNILGPSIGQQNLTRGLEAFFVSVVAVALFMGIYFFFAGFIADFALLLNGLIIFGVMAMIEGTFTLPGLAGVVLTMGMAVDANVLIYERIREEMAGTAKNLREAVREGYARAFSTILDANLTNLIVCAVLYQTATTEVKGFAVTLSIGILGTLFTALFVTRTLVTLYIESFGIKKLSMLPIVIPNVGRMLRPSINWLNFRWGFWGLSSLLIASSIWAVQSRGVSILDTEFRGGVAATMQTALLSSENEEPRRIELPLDGPDSVKSRIREISENVDGNDTESLILREMANSVVLTVGETRVDQENGSVWASSFQVKVANPPGLTDEELDITPTVVNALVQAFGDQLDVPPPVYFDGVVDESFARYTYPVERAHQTVGDVLGRGQYKDSVRDLLGGVAVLLEGINPPVSLNEIEKRIERMRQQPEYSQKASGRDVEVFGLESNPATSNKFVSAVVIVRDSDMNYLSNDPEAVDERLAALEFELISQAMRQPTSLEQVSSFSSSIADSLAAKAYVAIFLSLLMIVIYIAFRFGSIRYSFAAVAALLHDVILTMGALAISAYLASNFSIARTFLIEPFQIDLGVVAAILTVIGYSLNDTIVIMDRIRENRGKLPVVSDDCVNVSINQTISRTVLTSVTTLIAVLIIYIEGGSGIRPFAFCLLIGILVGTYSSVAVASPFVRGGRMPNRRKASLVSDDVDSSVEPVLEN